MKTGKYVKGASKAEHIASAAAAAKKADKAKDATRIGKVAKKGIGTIDGIPKGSLGNVEARKWYLSQEAKIKDMINSSRSLKNQAKQAFKLRNKFRTQARKLMADKKLAKSLFKTDPNMSWKQIVKKYTDNGYSGDKLWQEIINASTRSRSSVNNGLGIK